MDADDRIDPDGDDSYVELCEHARDALRDVIKQTEPGTGWALHRAYESLSRCIAGGGDSGDAPPEPTEKERRDAEWAAREALYRAWTLLPRDQRDQVILEVIGEAHLTIRQVTERINERHAGVFKAHQGNMSKLLKQMVARGELNRTPEAFQGKTRYRYSRTTELSGPIAELERAFDA